MDINYLLVSIVIILLICIIRGASKGILRIVFGLIGWIFLICFVNYGSEFVSNYMTDKTGIPELVQESIDNHLHKRYLDSEEKEVGSGENAVMVVVPEYIKEKIVESVRTSIDATISFIASELTLTAIKGISIILCVIVGILIIFIIDKIIKTIGLVPGVKDVNRLLGILAGFGEGMIIVWLLMFIADCFPSSAIGAFVLENLNDDQLLAFIHNNNIIKGIIGS